MKIEVDSEAKCASVEGIVSELSHTGYDSHPDITIDDGSEYGMSLARWIEELSMVQKGKKIVVTVMIFDVPEKK